MYLSRIILDTSNRAVRQGLADCDAMHRTVMSGFPTVPIGVDARAHMGVLYRLDPHPRTGQLALLVQSRVEPDWTGLDARYLWDTGGDPKNPDCRSLARYLESLEAGMVLIFRLQANATKRIDRRNTAESERWHGKRVELRREADQLEWLERKADQCGFQLLNVRVSPAVPNVRMVAGDRLTGVHRSGGRDQEPGHPGRLTFGSVLFEGELTITDADAFRRALENGIGSGKAYGFGLLSVARPRG